MTPGEYLFDMDEVIYRIESMQKAMQAVGDHEFVMDHFATALSREIRALRKIHTAACTATFESKAARVAA